jgi:hypothetical protein
MGEGGGGGDLMHEPRDDDRSLLKGGGRSALPSECADAVRDEPVPDGMRTSDEFPRESPHMRVSSTATACTTRARRPTQWDSPLTPSAALPWDRPRCEERRDVSCTRRERRVNLLSLPQLRLTLLQLKLLLLRTLLQLYLLLPACRPCTEVRRRPALCRRHRPRYDGRAPPPATAGLL